MDTILTKRKTKFTSKDCDRLKIGKWTSQQITDGLIVWTKKKPFFGKDKNTITVWATPHYNKQNEVAVDVTKDGEPILSRTFELRGEWVESDLKKYLIEMTEILTILK